MNENGPYYYLTISQGQNNKALCRYKLAFFRSANLDPFSLSLTSEELDRKVYASVPFRYELIFYGLKNTPCYSVYNDIVLVFAQCESVYCGFFIWILGPWYTSSMGKGNYYT